MPVEPLICRETTEALGIVNRGCDGEFGEMADTWNYYQPAASLGCFDHPLHVRVDRHDRG
jgi:hypothetical protein